jgi:hypothetical protein
VIQLGAAPATQHVLVWVTALAPNNGQFASEIGEVTVAGAPS